MPLSRPRTRLWTDLVNAGDIDGDVQSTLTRPNRSVEQQAVTDAANDVGGADLGVIALDAGDLSWGTIDGPTTKSITLSGTGADSYAGRLEFTGAGTASFQVISYITDGVTYTLDTPHACSSGDFAFTFADGNDIEISFEPVPTEAGEQLMTVTIVDIAGEEVDTVDADVTFGDIVMALINLTTPLDMWSAHELATGVIVDEGIAMEALNGDEPDLIHACLGLGVGTWSVDDTLPLGNGSLSKHLRMAYRKGFDGVDEGYANTANLSGKIWAFAFVARCAGDPGTSEPWVGNANSVNEGYGGERVSIRGFTDGMHLNQNTTTNVSLDEVAADTWYVMFARRTTAGAMKFDITAIEGVSPTLGDFDSGGPSADGVWNIGGGESERLGVGIGLESTEVLDVGPIIVWDRDLTDQECQDVIDAFVAGL